MEENGCRHDEAHVVEGKFETGKIQANWFAQRLYSCFFLVDI